MQRLKSKSLPFLSQIQGIFLNPNLTIFKSKRKTGKSPSPTFETVMKLQQCLDKRRVLRFHENFPIWPTKNDSAVLPDVQGFRLGRHLPLLFHPLVHDLISPQITGDLFLHNLRQRSTTGPLPLPPKQHFSQRFNPKKNLPPVGDVLSEGLRNGG